MFSETVELFHPAGRSPSSATVAEAAGFGTTYNVTQGFEGGPGAAGWKYAGLPWTQG